MKVLYILFAAANLISAEVVEGTVRNSVTGAPVTGARVEFVPEQGIPVQTKTDTSGTFRVEAKSLQGHWKIYVSNPGFAAGNFPQTGKPSDSMRLDLSPLASLSGQVRDRNGKPLASIRVSVRNSEMSQHLTTTREGSYSVSVPPGVYTIAAIPSTLPPTGTVKDPESDTRRKIISPTWYPSSPFPQGASRLVVGPGQEFRGADITMQEDWANRVSGRVVGLDGKPAANASVTLESTQDWSGAREASSFRAGQDGHSNSTMCMEASGVFPHA